MTSQLRRKHPITVPIHPVIPTDLLGRSGLLVLIVISSLFSLSTVDAQSTALDDFAARGTFAVDPVGPAVSQPPATYASSTTGGGFGGYLPNPVRVSSGQRSSRWEETAKSLQEKIGSARNLQQKIGTAMKSQLKTTGDSLKSAFQSVAEVQAERLSFRSVLVNPPAEPRRRSSTRQTARFGQRPAVRTGENSIRPVAWQQPVEAGVDETELLDFEFSESNELPLESPQPNRTAAIPADWPVADGRPFDGEQPPSVYVPGNRPGGASLPADGKWQDGNLGGDVELDLASPVSGDLPQEEVDQNNELQQNRDQQRLEELEGDMELRLLDSERFQQDGLPLQDQSCAAFREKLLNNPITEIALDLSPPGSNRAAQGLKRVWTNRDGEVLATGTLVNLSRGYATIETEDGLKRLAVARLNDADWSAIAEQWRIPVDCSVGGEALVDRHWHPQTFTWTASSLCHKPLYFENIQLERYGHSAGPLLQPVQSTVHFFRSYVTLPFRMALNPPMECQYSLGFYRPGNCAPWLVQPIPFNVFDKCFYQPAEPTWSW